MSPINECMEVILMKAKETGFVYDRFVSMIREIPAFRDEEVGPYTDLDYVLLNDDDSFGIYLELFMRDFGDIADPMDMLEKRTVGEIVLWLMSCSRRSGLGA